MRGARRIVGVADVNDRFVVDEVQFLNGGRVDGAVEDLLEAGVQVAVAGDGAVQDDCLVPVGRQYPWVVAHEHHQEDQGHQGQRQPHGLDPQSRNEAKGQGGEVVSHLVLGQLGGAEPDDGQDPEEAQPEAEAGGRAGEGNGHGHDADIHAEVGDDEVAAPVPAQVQGERQDGDGGQVGGDEKKGCHGVLRNQWVDWSLRFPARLCGDCGGTMAGI